MSMNTLKTAALLGFLTAILLIGGQAIAGRQGLYIHPNIWHEGVFTLDGTQRFFDKQGAVHARVSVEFASEFGCLLEAAIARD